MHAPASTLSRFNSLANARPLGQCAAACLALIVGTSTGCSRVQSAVNTGPGRWAQPANSTTTANSSTPTNPHTSQSHNSPANYTANNTPSHGVAVEQPAQQMTYTRRGFDPLWVESVASAERQAPGANWQPYNTNTVAYTPNTDPHNYTSSPQLRTGGLDFNGAAAASASPVDDGPDSLTHVTFAPDGADFDPCVSRDGRFMVFASTQHRNTADIYYKKIDGRTVTQLTADPAQDVMPSVSPDGKRIAFCSNRRGNWDVFVMSTSGGQAVQITSEGSHELHPTWSPDGTRLAFCRLGQTSGRWEIWVTDAGGSNTNEFIGYGLFPEWCPIAGTGEGSRDRILFQRSRERGDRAFSVWTIDYKPGDASSPTEIVANASSALINAAWSPDGQSVVYATVSGPTSDQRTARAGKSQSCDLWITNVDGTGRVALTSGSHLNVMPTWASDGRIYFVSDRTGTNNIWSLGTEKAMLAARGSRKTDPAQAAAPNIHPPAETHEVESMPESSTATVPTEEEPEGH